ncbi:MAG: hypothetical protein KC766_05015, partial [Myxococcales bacterium]|nr:hypothetical protein [Myxococcales bacterium]
MSIRVLQARAYQLLRSGAARIPTRGRVLLRAACLPSNKGGAASWELCEIVDSKRRRDHVAGFRTHWDLEEDQRRLDHKDEDGEPTEPTLVTSRVRVPTPLDDELLALVANLHVPLWPSDHPRGLDGAKRVL